MPFLPKVLSWLRKAAGLFPLSAGGVLLALVLAYGIYFEGLKRADMVVLVASASIAVAGLVTLLMVSGFAITTARRWREQVRSEGPTRLVVGAPSWTGLVFRPLWLPFVEVSWECHYPLRIETDLRKGPEGLVEVLIPARRCLVDRLERRVRVRDVLGVASISWQKVQTGPIEVLPEAGRLEVDTLVQSLFAGDDLPDPAGEPMGDRVDMRRYSPGDPPRLILWKVYARTRKLMVRVPERAVVTQPRTCAYLVAGPGDENCAALMRSVIERDLLGQGWRFGADGSTEPSGLREEALRMLARSGNPEVKSGHGLESFLSQAHADGFGSCLVVVPPRVGAWSDKVAAAIRNARLGLTVLSAAPPAGQSQAQSWEKLLMYEPEGFLDPPDRLFAPLRRNGVSFLLYDHHRGRVFPDYQFGKA
ncbi:MAG: DUF58 domain-containing protein [Vulcanimicrobiota bacterium]